MRKTQITNINTLLFLIISAMLVVTCTKESNELSLIPNVEDNAVVIRSNPIDCNLLTNGDFEDGFFGANGKDAFCNNDVPFWSNQSGTPDIVSNDWHWGHTFAVGNNPWWDPSSLNISNNRAFIIASSDYSEVIEQKGLQFDPTLTYQLDFDVATTNWTALNDDNGGLVIHSTIDNQTPFNTSCSPPYNYPLCGTNVTCKDVSIPNNQIHPSYMHVTHTFNNLSTANTRLLIWGTNNHLSVPEISFNSYGVFIDNVELTCLNKSLTGIKYTNNSGCTFKFKADFTGLLPSIYTAFWDFGDGNTSNNLIPTHSFGTTGDHTVTVTIKDQNGCCATQSVVVNCQGCDHRICWSDSDPLKPDMQELEDIIGLKVTMANGTENNYTWYSPAQDITGLHADILGKLQNTLNAEYGIPITNIIGNSNDHFCDKQGLPVAQGFFLSDIPNTIAKLEFTGFDDSGNNITVEFFTPCL